jgi:hypothetical protein
MAAIAATWDGLNVARRNWNATGTPERTVTPDFCRSRQRMPTTRTPLGVGEARPRDAVLVLPRTKWLDQADLVALYEQGYPLGILLGAVIHGHAPVSSQSGDRRKLKGSGHVRQEWDAARAKGLVDPEHPYVPAAPGKRTTRNHTVTRQQFVTATSAMHMRPQMAKAALEVLVFGRPVPAVAKRHKLKRRTLEATAYRVRRRVKPKVT